MIYHSIHPGRGPVWPPDQEIDQKIVHQLISSSDHEIDHQITTSPDHQILRRSLLLIWSATLSACAAIVSPGLTAAEEGKNDASTTKFLHQVLTANLPNVRQPRRASGRIGNQLLGAAGDGGPLDRLANGGHAPGRGSNSAPACSDVTRYIAPGETLDIVRTCFDWEDDELLLGLSMDTAPTQGAASALDYNHVRYTANVGAGGTDTFTFRATDPSGAVSAPATERHVPDSEIDQDISIRSRDSGYRASLPRSSVSWLTVSKCAGSDTSSNCRSADGLVSAVFKYGGITYASPSLRS